MNLLMVDGLYYWVELFGYIIDYEVYNKFGGVVGKDGIMSIEEFKFIGVSYSGNEEKIILILSNVINFMIMLNGMLIDLI